MPGYPADFVVLSDDITKIARSSIYDVKVLATVIDGKTMYTTRGVGV
jgi:predicted amidohydrolase YtcJ